MSAGPTAKGSNENDAARLLACIGFNLPNEAATNENKSGQLSPPSAYRNSTELLDVLSPLNHITKSLIYWNGS